MYIDSLNNPIQTAVAAGASAAAQVSTARPAAQTDTDNTARADATEGGSAQTAQAASQTIASKDDADAGAVSGYTAKDNRTLAEKKADENKKIREAIERMNAQLPNSEVKFGIHEKTNRVTIKILDRDTKELIKEFPPEKTLDMIAKCMELAGVLMDEKL